MWYRVVTGEPRPYRNISSSYLWGYVLVNEAMPSLEPNATAALDAKVQLVLMAANQREVEAARWASSIPHRCSRNSVHRMSGSR
jgi:hypothetical protein